MSHWTLFSNHGHVLLFVSHQPEARLRDIADRVGITERAVQKIVRDLQDGGLLSVAKHGRCNRYQVHGSRKLRHDLEAHCTVASLVSLIHPDGAPGTVDEVADTGLVTGLDAIAPMAVPEALPPPGVPANAPAPVVADAAPEPEPETETQGHSEPESEPEAVAATPPERPRPAPARKGRKRPAGNGGEQGSLF